MFDVCYKIPRWEGFTVALSGRCGGSTLASDARLGRGHGVRRHTPAARPLMCVLLALLNWDGPFLEPALPLSKLSNTNKHHGAREGMKTIL